MDLNVRENKKKAVAVVIHLITTAWTKVHVNSCVMYSVLDPWNVMLVMICCITFW